MNSVTCATSIPMVTLLAYWLGELDGATESKVEEHLFGCAECSARLRELVQVGAGVRRATREGGVLSVVTPAFIRRLQTAGLRIREYQMHPGGSVLCTIAPEDDLVVAHLHAPLTGVKRLDLVLHDVTAAAHTRLEDVAFDSACGEVVLVPSAIALRHLTHATQRAELFAVDCTGERAISEYTFNHYPHSANR